MDRQEQRVRNNNSNNNNTNNKAYTLVDNKKAESRIVGDGGGGGTAVVYLEHEDLGQPQEQLLKKVFYNIDNIPTTTVTSAAKGFEQLAGNLTTHKAFIVTSLEQLETLVERLKLLLLATASTANNVTTTTSGNGIDQGKLTRASLDMAAVTNNNEKITRSSVPNNSSTTDEGDGSAFGQSSNSSTSSSTQEIRMSELRTILADIEIHLAVLKDIEKRHALVCEEYGRKIQTREDTILGKSEQLSLISQENLTLQVQLQQLQMQNRQLEYEINYYKENTLSTIGMGVEPRTTPEEAWSASSMDSKDETTAVISKASSTATPVSEVEINVIAASEHDTPTPAEVGEAEETKASTKLAYEELFDDDGEIEKMLSKLPKPKIVTSTLAEEIQVSLEKVKGIQQQKYGSVSTTTIEPSGNDKDGQENYHQDKSKDEVKNIRKKVSIAQPEVKGENVPENVEDMDKPEADEKPKKDDQRKPSIEVIDVSDVGENQYDKTEPFRKPKPVLNCASREETPKFLIDLAAAAAAEGSNKPTAEGNSNVNVTSMKVYEHFVNMQQDIETLVVAEEKWRSATELLEAELAEVSKVKEDQDYKLSEVEYELDILKHNYNLEIESFGSAVNERETLIEKLQEKIENLRKRYISLDEKFQQAIGKEVGYKATIEEYEGRVKYEQLQREAAINVRVAELEQRLRDIESEYQVEISNLRTDISCKISIEKELRKQLEELEKASSSNGNAGNGDKINGNGDEDASAIYYKAQVEALFKEIEREKQERQAVAEKFDDELRLKEKQFDYLKGQARKDKDVYQREKLDSDQKFRKLISKFKIKEREILALQEKLQLLNEKFAKHRCYLGAGSSIKTSTLEPITEHSSEGTLVGNAAEEGPLVDIKSDEQLMAEMALLEAKLLDLKGKLDEAEDKNSNLDEELSKERNKRRELESHFLGSLNHRYNGGNGHRGSLLSAGDFERSGLLRLDEWHDSSVHQHQHHQQQQHHHHHHQGLHHRNSAASLALLMSNDENNEKELRDVGVVTSIWRYLQRQRDIFSFGTARQRTVRVVMIFYIVIMHYALIKHFLA